MRNMRLKPALTYRFKDSLRGVFIFAGVYLAIYTVLFLIAGLMADWNVSMFGSYGFSAVIFIFVFGICTIRDDLRTLIQHGAGRRTAFLANMLSAAATAAILLVVGKCFQLLETAITGAVSFSDIITDDLVVQLWQMEPGSTAAYLLTAAAGFLVLLLAHLGGSLISLLFYRLPKPWNIVAGVGVPLLLLNGLPLLAFSGADWLTEFVRFIFSGILPLLCALAALCLLTALCNWLLVRRTPIRAAK